MTEPQPTEQEISLRDIYLIIRRNIVVVLAVPVILQYWQRCTPILSLTQCINPKPI